MDTLVSMRVFASVSDIGSFSGAAARLGISRAMASKHIQHLEEHLGTRLLQRTTRRLGLTESGQAYFERCRQILSDIDEAEASAAELTVRPSGTLRVTLPVSFGLRHVSPLIAEFLAKHPEVNLDVLLSDRRMDLIEEGIDLAVRIGASLEPGLVARQLGSDRLVICGSPAYLARHGTPKRPADLAAHNCVLYSYAAMQNEWTMSGPDGQFKIKVAGNLRVNNGDFLNRFVIDGGGLACQPSFLVQSEIMAGTLVEVLDDYVFPQLGIFAVYPSRKHLSAKIRTFVDHLAERFSQKKNWSD